jgi:outer membrane protein OmpA-like peptidoglycan-associated protein
VDGYYPESEGVFAPEYALGERGSAAQSRSAAVVSVLEPYPAHEVVVAADPVFNQTRTAHNGSGECRCVEPGSTHREAPASSTDESPNRSETHWEVDEFEPQNLPSAHLGETEAPRLATYRVKSRLEHPDLAHIARLQEAVSAAAKALNVGIDSGEAVRALQNALRKLHYRAGDGGPVPVSGVYDAATQSAVAALQRDSGIPYPTGRQAGPKTLSAIDDRLLKGQPKPDNAECTTYRPGERQAAATSPGKVHTDGQELRLYDFGVASPRAKPAHERAVNEFVQRFNLFDPEHSEWQVGEIVGFSDAVDNEEQNSDLRARRAADVRYLFTRNGVPDSAMFGADRAASLMEYERGCTPNSRSWDRSVVIRLRWKRPKPQPAPKPKPDRNPNWQPAGICKTKPSTKWSIRGNGAVSSPTPLVVAVHGNFTLTDRTTGMWRILSFTGTGGQVGKSFPLSVGIDNATDFETTTPQYFENFEGQGAIIFGEAMFVVGYGVGRMLLHPHTEPGFISGNGFQLGLGADVTFVGGKWYFDPALGMTCHGGAQGELEWSGERESVAISARTSCSCGSHETSTDRPPIAAEFDSGPRAWEFGVAERGSADESGEEAGSCATERSGS